MMRKVSRFTLFAISYTMFVVGSIMQFHLSAQSACSQSSGLASLLRLEREAVFVARVRAGGLLMTPEIEQALHTWFLAHDETQLAIRNRFSGGKAVDNLVIARQKQDEAQVRLIDLYRASLKVEDDEYSERGAIAALKRVALKKSVTTEDDGHNGRRRRVKP